MPLTFGDKWPGGVLVDINLLRKGRDIPEASLVASLDADKEGFLRSERSPIQTCGRATQLAYNAELGITPHTVKKSLRSILENIAKND